MSQVEHIYGELIEMNAMFPGDTFEEKAKAACEYYGFNRSALWADSWRECLHEEGYRTVFIRNEIIYEVHARNIDFHHIVDYDSESTIVYPYHPGSLFFNVKWYNGGGSFDEVLEAAFQRVGL